MAIIISAFFFGARCSTKLMPHKHCCLQLLVYHRAAMKYCFYSNTMNMSFSNGMCSHAIISFIKTTITSSNIRTTYFFPVNNLEIKEEITFSFFLSFEISNNETTASTNFHCHTLFFLSLVLHLLE